MRTSCRGQDKHLQLKRSVLKRALVVSRQEGAGVMLAMLKTEPVLVL